MALHFNSPSLDCFPEWFLRKRALLRNASALSRRRRNKGGAGEGDHPSCTERSEGRWGNMTAPGRRPSGSVTRSPARSGPCMGSGIMYFCWGQFVSRHSSLPCWHRRFCLGSCRSGGTPTRRRRSCRPTAGMRGVR